MLKYPLILICYLVFTSYSGYLWSQDFLETHHKAIRNGSIFPQNIYLNNNKLKAIGWLYKGSASQRFCSATLISRDLILTARHCFENEETGAYEFPQGDVGFAILKDGSNGFDYEALFPFDESYLEIHETMDVAIIRYPNFPFDAYNVTPIAINQTSLEEGLFTTIIDQNVDAAGYGITFEERAQGRYFTSVHVELINSRSLIVNGEWNQGICRGDSGGPILANGIDGQVKVIGVVSKGDPCCVGIDQVTRIDVLFDWIQNYSFVDPIIETPLPRDCWGISTFNSCKKDILLSCYQGIKQEVDCNENQAQCDFDPTLGIFNCISLTQRQASCQSLSKNGECMGNTLVRCERGELQSYDCGLNTCMVIEEKGSRVACVDLGAYTRSPNDPLYISNCDPNNLDRLDDIGQAKFIAVSSCQSVHTHYLPILILSFIYTILLFIRRFTLYI